MFFKSPSLLFPAIQSMLPLDRSIRWFWTVLLYAVFFLYYERSATSDANSKPLLYKSFSISLLEKSFLSAVRIAMRIDNQILISGSKIKFSCCADYVWLQLFTFSSSFYHNLNQNPFSPCDEILQAHFFICKSTFHTTFPTQTQIDWFLRLQMRHE